MSTSDEAMLTTIHRLEDIPAFAGEAEEHAFWATHEMSDDLWEQAKPLGMDELPPPRVEVTPIAIHLDAHTLQRVKALAQKQHRGYQTLIKEFVTERLYEEEKRAGLR